MDAKASSNTQTASKRRLGNWLSAKEEIAMAFRVEIAASAYRCAMDNGSSMCFREMRGLPGTIMVDNWMHGLPKWALRCRSCGPGKPVDNAYIDPRPKNSLVQK